MKVWWCRGCGMEDTVMRQSCPTCGSAMQVTEIEWLNDGDEGEETVFELETEPRERAAIVQALMTEGIRHRWEGVTDLVAADINVDAVDKILDDVLGADSAVDADDDDDDFGEYGGGGGEDDYGVLSQLYDVANRLRKKRDDEGIADFLDATGATLAAPTPFGIDDETWADIQSAARNTAAALQEDPNAPIDADLKALHNQLHQLV